LGQSKLVVALFLGCVVLALFSPSHVANAQSITTLSTVQSFALTSVTAVTSTLTSTVVTPQTVRYDLTPLDFNSVTGTFILGYSETAPYLPQNPLCLMYDYFLLNATTAYEFKVHFDTQQDIPIQFLILNMDQFNKFNHTNCANGFSGWELQVVAPASDLVWVVPQSGEYVFLFLSRQFVGGYIHLSVQAYGQVVQTSTSTYTTPNIIQILSTQTALSTLPATTAPTDYSALIVGAIIIALVLTAAAILRKKRTPKTRINISPDSHG